MLPSVVIERVEAAPGSAMAREAESSLLAVQEINEKRNATEKISLTAQMAGSVLFMAKSPNNWIVVFYYNVTSVIFK